MIISCEEAKGLVVKDPYVNLIFPFRRVSQIPPPYQLWFPRPRGQST